MQNPKKCLPALIASAILGACQAHAAAWPPFDLMKVENGQETAVQFTPLEKSQKKWSLCVLLPHIKDSYWVGVDYGVVEEAKRLGASVTIYQAGGYDRLPKQVSQYDDCLASKPDAIIVGPISEAGVAAKMKESMAKGIPTISFVNPLKDTPITSMIFVDFERKGAETARFLKDRLGGKGGSVAAFPGPQGSGWAESYLKGFEGELKGSNVKIADARFGDAGLSEQLRLVEDTLQSYPDISAIWGVSVAAEAAVGALDEAGMKGIPIVASSENIAVVKLVKEGAIDAVGTEFPVMQAKIAVNLAIKALQGEPVEKHYTVVPKILTSKSVDIDVNQILAPEGFQPVFSVK